MKKKASLFQNWLVKTLMHLCPDILDGILAVILMVSLAPTDSMAALDMEQVMDMADTPVVGIKAQTNIIEPTLIYLVFLSFMTMLLSFLG